MAGIGQSGFSGGDYASRYAETVSRPGEIGDQLVSRMLGRGQMSPRQAAVDAAAEVDRRLAGEARKGDSSIVGYLDGYAGRVQKIVDLMQSDERNFVEAERLYRDLQETASDNQDGLASVISVSGRGGAYASALGDAATKLKSGAYSQTVVNMSGQDVTLGQLFGGQGYVANRMNQFKNFGYDAQVADAYFGEDANLSSAVGVFLRPGISTGGTNGDPRRVYNVGLLNEAASYVADRGNYAKMASLFGEGNVASICSDVLRRFGDTGGMTEVMRGIVKYAESRGGSSPDDGLAAVRNFMSCVDASTQAMFSDPVGGRVPENLPASERRWALMTSLAALGAATDRGEVLDFGKDSVRAAAMDAATAVNLARYSGYDLFSAAKTAGRNPMSEYKEWIGSFMDGAGLTPDTFVARELGDRSVLRSRIAVAPVVTAVPTVRSGAAGVYSAASSRASGNVLTSESAGVLNNDLENAIMRVTAPRRLSGQNLDRAVAGMLTDGAKGGGRETFVSAVTSVFSRAIPGYGGRILAEAVLVPALESRLMSTDVRPFEMHRIMEDIATKEGDSQFVSDLPERDREAAVASAKNWFTTNVSEAERFRSYRDALIDHLTDGRFNVPLKGDAAARRADVILQNGLELLKRTDNPMSFDQYVNAFTDLGVEYAPRAAVFDRKTGKQVEWESYDGGVPALTREDEKSYRVGNIQLVLPDGTSAGDAIFPRSIRGVNAIRMGSNPGWISANEANRQTYLAQQRFLNNPKNLKEE